MKIDLTPELERLVQSKVNSGHYDSVSDMLSEALRLLDERDRFLRARKEEYQEQIEEGWLAARSGDFVDGDLVFDRIDAELAAAEIATHDLRGRG